MASLRRNRATAADGATPRFLYAILKQLDLKSIDWNEVAHPLGITNGHAARMRYSRFKQQMEGIRPTPRKPKTAATQKKSVKEKQNPKSRSKTKPEENLKREIPEEMVGEPGQAIPSLYEQAPAEQSTRIKHEPLEISNQGNAGDMEWMSLEPYSCPEKSLIDPKLEDADLTPTSAFQAIKEEPRVKMEPIWN